MTVETEVKPDAKEAPAGKVGHAELAAAFDAETQGETEAKPEAKAELKPEEKKPLTEEEEELDQKERSRLGRRVKRMEETVNERLQRIEEMLTSKTKYDVPENAERTEVPEIVTTAEDVERVLSARDKRQLEAQKTYETDYMKTIRKFAAANSEDADFHEEVVDEMMQKFNVKRTGNAAIDAELNYEKAKTSLLLKKAAPHKPKPNVKNEKAEVSTSLNVESRETRSASQEPELDDVSKEFVKRTGMNSESIKEALKGESRIRTAGGIR